MDVERLERVKELFEAALERDEPERSAFLDEACSNDPELRHELDSLLSGERNAGDFLKEPVAHIPPAAFADDHPPATFSPGETVSGRFQILRFIGRGGMGEVYEARDLERHVRVALKTIRPEIASNPKTMARFKREIDLALRVTHHNVCRVYHLERHRPSEGSGKPEVVFLTMELLEGETLADRLRRRGRMTCEEALPLIRQMADGVAAAHKQGVVHCDFKPGNVMLVSERQVSVDPNQETASGSELQAVLTAPTASAAVPLPKPTVRAVITDFGLARAMRPMITRETIQESLDSDTTGHLVGTLPYMAPEQLEGHAAVTASDVYAFGLVMYEMVTGRQPFSGDTPLSAIYRRLQAAPPKPRTLAPGIDAGLQSVIMRCLEREPRARYGDAGQVVDALGQGSGRSAVARKWPWMGAALILLALLLGILRYFYMKRGVLPPKGGNLVVLPFSAIGGRADELAYCEGFTVALTTQLAEVPSLPVVPYSEVRKSHVNDVPDARAVLGATLVLLATWQRLGDTIVITVALMDTRTNRQLRSQIVHGSATNLFALQNQVVEAAVGLLDVESPPAATMGTTESSAYDYYIKGRGYLQQLQKPESVEAAIGAFRSAIQTDPGYGLAHAGLGESYWWKFFYTRDSGLVNRTREECTRAVDSGNGGAEAYICLGMLYNGTGQFEQAVDQYRRAIELEPTNDDAYVGLAQAYDGLYKTEDAIRTYRKAISLRPELIAPYNWLGMFYEKHGDFKAAADLFSQVTTMSPQSYVGHNNLGTVYLYQGLYSKALEEFQKSLAIRPTYFAYSNLGTLYFQLSHFTEAARSCEAALKINDTDYSVWGNLGDAYNWAPGEREKAPEAYREAIARGTKALAVNPRDYSTLGWVGTYYAMLGDFGAATQNITGALKLAPNDAEVLFNAAHIYNQLGDTSQAIEWLKKALGAGYDPGLVRDSAYFNNLRRDSRFQTLLRERLTSSGGGT
ncbi:MAG TPA: tetratricopeptide repeat protein [Terriglobia bacterium]|nr:tetratricopeptide repeat protein [Terriglobia bacterium]